MGILPICGSFRKKGVLFAPTWNEGPFVSSSPSSKRKNSQSKVKSEVTIFALVLQSLFSCSSLRFFALFVRLYVLGFILLHSKESAFWLLQDVLTDCFAGLFSLLGWSFFCFKRLLFLISQNFFNTFTWLFLARVSGVCLNTESKLRPQLRTHIFWSINRW